MKRIIRKGASLILFMAMVINSFSYLPIYAQENNVGNEDTTTQIEDSENNAESLAKIHYRLKRVKVVFL